MNPSSFFNDFPSSLHCHPAHIRKPLDRLFLQRLLRIPPKLRFGSVYYRVFVYLFRMAYWRHIKNLGGKYHE